MSCGGNRFQCNLTKATRFKFQPDKPSNPELHNENQKRLSDLLRAREDMDKGIYQTTEPLQQTTEPLQQTTEITIQPLEQNTQYTPWKTPSTDIFQKKN
jgi:hypothetical protein